MPKGQPPKTVYQIRVTLKWIEPPIWRQFLVEKTTPLPDLHTVLQVVMGWEFEHLYGFKARGLEWVADDSASEFGLFALGSADEPTTALGAEPVEEVAEPEITEAENAAYASLLANFPPARDRFRTVADSIVEDLLPRTRSQAVYLYDYGDSWEHDLVVEKMLAPDPAQKLPLCLDGARACPPEDCGGVWGYANLLDILKDRRHPEYAEMREWAGRYNPERFNLTTINRQLARLR